MALSISCIPGQKKKFSEGDDPQLFFVKFNKKDIPHFAKVVAYCHAHNLKTDIIQNMVERMVIEKKDGYLSQWLEVVEAYEDHSDTKCSISVLSNYNRLDDEMRNSLIVELRGHDYPLKSEPAGADSGPEDDNVVTLKTPKGKSVKVTSKDSVVNRMKTLKAMSHEQKDFMSDDLPNGDVPRLLNQILVELRQMNEQFRRVGR